MFVERLAAARRRRAPLAAAATLTAWRVVDGEGDGLPGIAIDRYGPCAVLNVGEDAGWADREVTAAANRTLDLLAADGVEAVYVKPFARDRSRLGGRLPDESRAPTPRAGRPQPAALTVEEYGVRFEVRPYDGLSTGLFLEHREHRRALAERRPSRVLNLFAYTCAFAVPLTLRGAEVINVDVSARYLDWGRRNLALNGLPAAAMRFLRRDARDYLRVAAARPDERFDLVVLDPPTFAAADRRRGIAAWRAIDHYPALIRAAAAVLAPRGFVFAATNTRELAAGRVLASLVADALGRTPRWLPLPPWPIDVTARGRVAAVLFAP
ncbi:MAG: class I SAM-dependent rRNA methyltransferase [Vicinamibacterales bacterium]